MSVEVTELPGGRVSTPHVTLHKAQVTVGELEEIAAEYAALIEYFRAELPVDPAEVDAVTEVLVAASTPFPAESARGQAERLVRGGVRKVGA